MAIRFIDDDIMRGDPGDPGDLRLAGGECGDCGLVSFPRATGCARCGGRDIDERLLAQEGRIWTWTTQGFLPKRPYTGHETPETFAPFVLGYVELPDGIRVEGRILATPDEVVIDQPVRLVAAPHTVDEDGTEVLMFAFAPSDGDQEVGQ